MFNIHLGIKGRGFQLKISSLLYLKRNIVYNLIGAQMYAFFGGKQEYKHSINAGMEKKMCLKTNKPDL